MLSGGVSKRLLSLRERWLGCDVAWAAWATGGGGASVGSVHKTRHLPFFFAQHRRALVWETVTVCRAAPPHACAPAGRSRAAAGAGRGSKIGERGAALCVCADPIFT